MAPRGLAKGKQAQKPAEAPAKSIWYLLVDHQRQLSFGASTQIAVSTGRHQCRRLEKEDQGGETK
jgi:hypothetical protein